MLGRWLLGPALLVALPTFATAQALPTLTPPTLALEPTPQPSIWHGLSVGAEVIGVASKHGGGFGGDVFAGYDREFANGIVLGVRGTTGYMPGFGSTFYRGFDFAGGEVRVGYDMGRLMPFVTAGVALAHPHYGVGLEAPGADSLNAVFNGGRDTRAITQVGAGVEYAVTDRLTVGVAVNAVQGRGFGPLLP